MQASELLLLTQEVYAVNVNMLHLCHVTKTIHTTSNVATTHLIYNLEGVS